MLQVSRSVTIKPQLAPRQLDKEPTIAFNGELDSQMEAKQNAQPLLTHRDTVPHLLALPSSSPYAYPNHFTRCSRSFTLHI
jgi:hypothetical protein